MERSGLKKSHQQVESKTIKICLQKALQLRLKYLYLSLPTTKRMVAVNVAFCISN
jgi:hypothetical protein